MPRISDIFANLPSLDTEGLLLRQLTRADAENMYAYASDPLIARYTSWEPHRTVADSRSFLEQVMAISSCIRSCGVNGRVDGRMDADRSGA